MDGWMDGNYLRNGEHMRYVIKKKEEIDCDRSVCSPPLSIITILGGEHRWDFKI